MLISLNVYSFEWNVQFKYSSDIVNDEFCILKICRSGLNFTFQLKYQNCRRRHFELKYDCMNIIEIKKSKQYQVDTIVT